MLWAIFLFLSADTPLVDVGTLDSRFLIDMPYATPNNFTGQTLYPVARCLLRPKVASAVVAAQHWLDVHHAGLRLMFKDCYRPEHIQNVMWAVVKGTPKQAYVADPHSKTGSVHNYGAAVDITLADLQGHELDMGTPYDFLGPRAEPRQEATFLKNGTLTTEHVTARHILRDAMSQGGGFHAISNEWWHFDALQGEALRKTYDKLDLPLESTPR